MLDQWDRHVITNVSGLPLSESYVVPRDEVVLEGRCRDFSMLRKFNEAPDTMIRWRFLPVKWVSTPSTSQANSAVESITLQLDRLSDLASNNKGNTLPRVYQQLIDSLHEHRVSVLLCCEDVDEEWIHYAASRSVTLVSGQEGMPMMYLPFPLDLTDMNALLSMLLLLFVIVICLQVDCVPVFYLERLATITETTLYDTAQEYLESLSLSLTTVVDSSIDQYPTITGLHRVTFGVRSDSYFRLTGLRGILMDEPHRSSKVPVATDKPTRTHLKPIAPQLVLHSSSIIAAGMHTRMLKRCLRSTIASTVITTSSFTQAKAAVTATTTITATATATASTAEAVWVPGAGAVEMGWAVLWSAIATRLHNNTTSIVTESFVAPLANDFAGSILESIHRIYSVPLHIVAAVVRCERLCEMFAAAYTRIPLLLLQNAIYTPHCEQDSTLPMMGMSRKVEYVWRAWNEDFVQPCSTGRLGLLTQVDLSMDCLGTTTDATSSNWCIDTPLCSLADVLTNSYQLSVMESASTQWEILAAVLGGCRLYLRIGGEDGVLHVRKLQGTSSLRGCFVTRKRYDEDHSTSDDDDEESRASNCDEDER